MTSLSARLLLRIADSRALPVSVRTRLLRAAGVGIGPRSLILNECGFYGPTVTIGTGTLVHHRVVFDGQGAVVLGDGVLVSLNVTFLTTGHTIADAGEQRGGTPFHTTVRVEDGAWIGAQCVIFPGVTIGAGAIVGAGSVVRRSVAPNSVVAPAPTKVVRTSQPLAE